MTGCVEASDYSRGAAAEFSHGWRPWLYGVAYKPRKGRKNLSPLRDSFDAKTYHGLRPWLNSAAALRLNHVSCNPRRRKLTAIELETRGTIFHFPTKTEGGGASSCFST